jgi:acetyl esterase/lipase
MPPITVASSIAPSDTTTSTVIKPDPADQIRYGETELEMRTAVFASHTRPDGSTFDLSMDIQAPTSRGAMPLVVFIPGGGFVFAMKELASDLRTHVAYAGFVVASIQYRTVLNGAVYSDGIADVKSAIRYLRAHAVEYSIDPAHVAVWGESSGGYLAAMVGLTNGNQRFDVGEHLDQSSDVQAVVDKFGPSDLPNIAADFDRAAKLSRDGPDNPVAKYVNGPASGKSLSDDPAAVADANPLNYVSASAPPFLLFHGSADGLVSPSQTLVLHEALRAAGANTSRYVLQDAGHGDMTLLSNSISGKPWSTNEVMDLIVSFLAKNLDR